MLRPRSYCRFWAGGFLPDLREGHFIAHAISLPGTSLNETERVGRKLSTALLTNPEVASVAQQIGRAELADAAGPTTLHLFRQRALRMGEP